MRTAAGHRFFPILWLTAMTGMRRNEVLGLTWPDIDFKKKAPRPEPGAGRGRLRTAPDPRQDPLSVSTRAARRNIDLDDTTIAVLDGWRTFQAAEHRAVGIENAEKWVFTDGDGNPIHPHALYQSFRRIVANADVPEIRFHELRHTHGSLLIKEGIPVKVVSERLGHAHIAHTIQSYQHLLPGMGAEAARTVERLVGPVPTTDRDTVERRGNNRRNTA